MTNWGEALQKAREEIGMSRQQLADALGCTYYCIRRWELGEREMSVTLAEKAFDIVGLKLELRCGDNNDESSV